MRWHLDQHPLTAGTMLQTLIRRKRRGHGTRQSEGLAGVTALAALRANQLESCLRPCSTKHIP